MCCLAIIKAAPREVSVITQPPADVLEAFRTAPEPDIQSWACSAGADGTAILAEYRRTIGREQHTRQCGRDVRRRNRETAYAWV